MDAIRFGAALLLVALAPGCDGIVTEDEAAPPAGPPSTLFIADYRANAIFRYDGPTGAFRDVFAAGLAQGVDRPASVQLGPRGDLYMAGFGRGNIVRYDAETGALRDVFYWDTRLLEEPVGLLFRGEELIALGNDTRNAVVIGPDGRARAAFGSPTMRAPQDVVLGPGGAAGTLFVATEHHAELGSAIQAWDLATGELLRHFGGYEDLAFAAGLALGADGLLYACDFERGRVMRFDPRTGASLGAFIDTGLASPVKLDVGPDGALYVLDAAGLHRFDAATGAHRGLVVAVGDGRLERPLGFRFVTDAALRASARDEP